MIFSYKGISKLGKSSKGIVEASNEKELIEVLYEKSIYCISFNTVENTHYKTLSIKRVSLKELSMFCKNINNTLKAGIKIDKALHLCINHSNHPTFKWVLKEVLFSIEQGKSLKESFDEHKKFFPQFFRTIVYIGETSGDMVGTFDFLEQCYSKKYTRRKKIINALIYPSFILGFSIIMALIMVVFILPQLLSNPMLNTSTLPTITRFYMKISYGIRENTFYALSMFTVTLGCILFFLRNFIKSQVFQNIIIRIPGVRKVIINNFLCDFTFSLSLLLSNGINIKNSIDIIKDSQGLMTIRNSLSKCNAGIEAGESIHHSLKATNMFSGRVLSMISIGEENGQLETYLKTINEITEEEFNNTISVLTVIIEPVLLILVGLFIASIIMSIMIPLSNIY